MHKHLHWPLLQVVLRHRAADGHAEASVWQHCQRAGPTSNVPSFTTYSSEAARPVSPSWMRISPAETLRTQQCSTTLA